MNDMHFTTFKTVRYSLIACWWNHCNALMTFNRKFMLKHQKIKRQLKRNFIKPVANATIPNGIKSYQLFQITQIHMKIYQKILYLMRSFKLRSNCNEIKTFQFVGISSSYLYNVYKFFHMFDAFFQDVFPCCSYSIKQKLLQTLWKQQKFSVNSWYSHLLSFKFEIFHRQKEEI